jgi:hypothetical protein
MYEGLGGDPKGRADVPAAALREARVVRDARYSGDRGRFALPLCDPKGRADVPAAALREAKVVRDERYPNPRCNQRRA